MKHLFAQRDLVIASGLQVPVNVSSVDKADEVWHPLSFAERTRQHITTEITNYQTHTCFVDGE